MAAVAMDRTLRGLIEERLAVAPPPGTRAAELVLAATDGAEALRAALAGSLRAVADPEPGRERAGGSTPGVFLRSITAEGFRGVGPETTLTLIPGPGLTIIGGRNGSGKSSFAEALEILLTGRNLRWEGRTKVWSGAWRNLHHEHARVAAEFVLERTPTAHRIVRSWEDGAELETSKLTVKGRPDPDLEGIGWRQALAAHRPMLTHNEMGTRLDGRQSDLHDALAGVLGLDDLTATIKLLSEERLARERARAAAGEALIPLRRRLEAAQDERARACLKALSADTWDLAAVAGVLEGDPAAGGGGAELALLGELARLAIPAAGEVAQAVTDLTEARAAVAAVQGTDADRARRTARLLEEALDLHRMHGDADCPVCGRTAALTGRWREQTGAEAVRLRNEAGAAEAAHRALDGAQARARRLLSAAPPALGRATEVGLETESVAAAWHIWNTTPDAPVSLAAHLAASHPGLATLLGDLNAAAAQELERRQDHWRPLASDLRLWLEAAVPAQAGRALTGDIGRAEKWLKGAAEALREERFRPIAEDAQRNWSLLRQQSNVDLGGIRLEGSSNSRRVTLDVTVDGAAGPALGVMSQGELNCLSLSLFLPRALLDESPFRFVVIDDPVQAMDPAKVDGLVRCLAASAEHRQVIVFTHDERLPAAVRYLGIAATILQVTRRESSVVEIREVADPVSRHIEDARAVAATQESNPHAARVVPGFCRSAIEAACMRVLRTRRLRAGRSQDEIEDEFSRVTTVTVWMALALADDARAGNQVVDRIRSRLGGRYADAFCRIRAGAHAPDEGELIQLTRATEKLAVYIQSLP